MYIPVVRINLPLEEFEGDYEAFDWREPKRETNLEQHKIDFADVPYLFFSRKPILRRRSDRGGQERFFAMGFLRDRVVVVVYTEECGPGCCHIISVRPASPEEREEFYAQIHA